MFTTPGIHQLRSLKSTTSVEDNSSQSNVTAIAEMTAAITDLDTWRKQRENDALVLKQKLTAIENEQEIESTNNTNKENNTKEKTRTSNNKNTNGFNIQEEDEDDDPVSKAYEARLQSELAALGAKREQLEEQSKVSPRAPQVYNMPTELLISASQIKALTEDTRKHVGVKSVEALKNEVRTLQYENELTSSTLTQMKPIEDSDVMKALAKEGSSFENMAGLSNVLEDFETQMADLLLKMDAVDASAIARTTPRVVKVVTVEDSETTTE